VLENKGFDDMGYDKGLDECNEEVWLENKDLVEVDF
jgi:hypothetical protein